MSIDNPQGATALLEDAELELASIRAALALQSLDRGDQRLAVQPAQDLNAPARMIDARGVDLTRIGHERVAMRPAEAEQPPHAPAPAAPAAPRRLTLRERLASLSRTPPDGD